jgi:hypothetical protein
MQPTAESAVAVSKVVLILDHIKNNRLEYIGLAILGHLAGLTSQATEYVGGMC